MSLQRVDSNSEGEEVGQQGESDDDEEEEEALTIEKPTDNETERGKHTALTLCGV